MNLKTTGWLLAIFGQILIILCFFVFFNLSDLIGSANCWLDCIVLSLIYWLWISDFFRHPIDLDDPSGKQAAGLGLRWSCIIFYSVCAGAVAIAGIVMEVSGMSFPFKWQLLAQLLILFIALAWLYIASSTTTFAGKVYEKEQQKMSGKVNLRYTLSELAEASVTNIGVPTDIVDRIAKLKEDTRYISPSSSMEASSLDSKIENEANALRLTLMDYKLNKDRATTLLTDLERHFAQRKQAY